jgi:WD40 repeat protein
LTRLYGALTGERPGFISAEDAAVELEKKLETKNCLIVIDDVWDLAHVRPFLRGGPGCARLVTTRMRNVAAYAQRVDVDEMSASEAVTLLTAKLKRTPSTQAAYAALAKRLGEWPLLLKLVGSALHEAIDAGDTPEGALKFVNDALDEGGVVVFDRDNTDDRNQAVAVTVGASLKLLAPNERERCLELGVFPEDAEIPISVTAKLWDSNPVRTRQLLQKLYGFSLIELDLATGRIKLHDALRAFFTAQLYDPEKAHGKLVLSWGDPHKLTETYAWRWIAYHLVGAGWKDQLRELLLDFSWLDAKLHATDVNFLLADFDGLTDEPSLRVVRDALRLSAHVLGRDKRQAASQLWGRIPEGELDLRTRLAEWTTALRGGWLRPTRPTLETPGGPLIRTLEGHTASVSAVAITPDGQRAVSASDDCTLRIWDLASGATLRTLEGHTHWVIAVAITPDGQRAVSASCDRTLRIWDIASGATLRTLEGHTGSVSAVPITPDGQRAVSASYDRTLRIWDIASGATLRTLEGHTNWVSAVTITPDGQRAVSASHDRTVRAWDLGTGESIATFSTDAPVTGCAIARGGVTIVAGDQGGQVHFLQWENYGTRDDA